MEFLGFTIDAATLASDATEWIVRIIVALLIFVVGRWLTNKVVDFADRVMKRSHIDATAADFLARLLQGILLVVVVLAALNKVGVHTTSVVAILGGAAVAIGFSLKDQLSNFAAGIIIVTFRPFVNGDFVQISDYTGTVTEITLVNTHLTTINNHDVIIPNSDISTSAIINYTALPNRRVDVTVGIGYGENIKRAKDLILEVAAQNSLAFKDPKPVVRVTNLGDNSVDLTLNVWASNDDWWSLQCDILEEIKVAFDEHKIEIPFPQRSVHIEGLENLITTAATTKALSKNLNT